jgi:hypothetical protein
MLKESKNSLIQNSNIPEATKPAQASFWRPACASENPRDNKKNNAVGIILAGELYMIMCTICYRLPDFLPL